MIVIETDTAMIHFAGNPILLYVNSNNSAINPGQTAFMTLDVYAVCPMPNKTLKISFGGRDFIFVTSAGTDESGLIIPVATTGQSVTAWGQTVFNAFTQNYDLLSNFNILGWISGSRYYISFESKERSAAYTMTFVNNGITGIELYGAIRPGIDIVPQPNFGILGRVMDESHNLIGEDIKPVDAIGSAWFDFSEYFMAFFQCWNNQRFEYPEGIGNIITHGRDYIVPVNAGFAEKYGGKVYKLHYDIQKYVFSGGLSREVMTSYNETHGDYFSNATNKQRFLTWLPVAKWTNTFATEKLFFLFQSKPAQLTYKVTCTIHWADGAGQVFDISPLTSYSDYSVVEIKCGHDHLNLAAINSLKTVSSWEIYIVDSTGNVVSEKRSFILDLTPHEYQRNFMFRNSFSAYDFVRFTGETEVNMEYERVTGSQVKMERYTRLNCPLKQFSVLEIQTFKANSGWLTQDVKNCFREMLLSKEVYEFVGTNLFPVLITSTKVASFLKDGEYLFNLELEYQRAYKDEYFSPLVLPKKWRDAATWVGEQAWSDVGPLND